MPATNEILVFANTDTGTNLLTQAEYSADTQRTNGNQPGTARSKLVNKVLRQTSIVSAGLSQFLADLQATAITDGLTPTEYAGLIEDAMSAFFDAKLAAAEVVKPGAMMMWPKSTPPTGWLKRNGAAISRTTYAALFTVLGTDFGVGDGSTTFNLPDDRANFERGWDDSRGIDSGRAFGSEQTSQNLSHTHTGTTSTNGSHAHGVIGGAWASGTKGLGEGSARVVQGSDNSGSEAYRTTMPASGYQILTNEGSHNHTFTTAGSGGTEARPRNRAYLPIIKY